MQKRKLGKSDLSVGALALGGNVFGWTADEATSFKLLDAFVDTDLNLIDTADSYSTWVAGHKGGESESILGHWFKRSGKRDKVVLATKVGSPMPPDKKGLSKKYIFEEIEASLRRLQTDHIDLYQSHRDDPETPVEETLAAYGELVKQGKVRYIGCSNFTAERIEESLKASRAHGYPEYVSLQPNFNLYDREDYEKNMEPTVVKHGLAVIPYFSLAAGFLTGKYRSKTQAEKVARGGMVTKFFTERGTRILAALQEVAKAHHATQAQVALAWLIARPSITAPIASATKLDQLHDIAASTKMSLTVADIEELNRASAY
ncbi:MAG TPA: aldo/keto reductase [Candidatus Koribacter sp.]